MQSFEPPKPLFLKQDLWLRCYFFHRAVVLLFSRLGGAGNVIRCQPKTNHTFRTSRRVVFEKADSSSSSRSCCWVEALPRAALTDMEAHILEAHLTKGRVSNSPCYKAETWDNSFCETPKALFWALLQRKKDDNSVLLKDEDFFEKVT